MHILLTIVEADEGDRNILVNTDTVKAYIKCWIEMHSDNKTDCTSIAFIQEGTLPRMFVRETPEEIFTLIKLQSGH